MAAVVGVRVGAPEVAIEVVVEVWVISGRTVGV
jgi:hypothetical protein